jgi:kynurenine formamidase
VKVNIPYGSQTLAVDFDSPFDLSIPFGNPDRWATAWGCGPAQFQPVVSGEWEGCVNSGASINFFQSLINPHGQGTHTEWAGHILKNRGNVVEQIRNNPCWAQLITLHPNDRGEVALPAGFQPLPEINALILRTRVEPLQGDQTGKMAVHIQPQTMVATREWGIQHLLVDQPSVDPEEDGGALLAHKSFWGLDVDELRPHATITEFVNVPVEIEDGLFFLHLHLAPFENDATPSRPLIYKPLEK